MRYVLPLVFVALLGLAIASIASEPAVPPMPSAYERHVAPLLSTYCLDCHSGPAPEGKLDLEPWSERTDWPEPKAVVAVEEQLERIAHHLERGVMPPENNPRPDPETIAAAVAEVRSALDAAYAVVPPDPGRVTIRRLSRTEYQNTVRDLLGIEIDASRWLPRDESGYGFDHIGDVLSMPPTLLEKYMNVAEYLAERAIVAVDPENPMRRELAGGRLRGTGGVRQNGGAWAMFSNGTVFGDVFVEREGVYVIRVRAFAQQAGPELAKMAVEVGGRAVETVEVGAEPGDAQVYEVETRVPRGTTRVGATFTNDYYRPQSPDPSERDRNLYVEQIEVVGPLAKDLGPPPASHARIVTRVPAPDGSDVPEAARAVVMPLARRAFRRPVSPADVERYAGLVVDAVAAGDPFERGVQLALQAMLVSPRFLFRVELDPDPMDAGAAHPLDEHELASRLSYFLWSTMPDDALFAAAEAGTLSRDLDAQVTRMLADPKAETLVTNFAAQWLQLPRLEAAAPDPKGFPTFNEGLKRSMRLETELFVEEVFRQDRSVLDLLDADFTYLDPILARFYGLPDLVIDAPGTPTSARDAFVRVDLPEDGPRGGVLTQASVLTLTSYPTRTSPVIRGKYVLEQILADPPPPPPPGVGVLDEQSAQQKRLPLRERLAIHRSDPTCATCHTRMDALGFGLERFDAIGRYRDDEGGHAIDSSGALPDGRSFDDARALGRILAHDPGFPRAFAEHLLTFALGRGLESLDKRALDAILDAAREDDFRFSAFVRAIIASPPFRSRRGESL